MNEFNNLIDTGRFLKVMADLETGRDEPEPHQFKRDQILTPVEQLRAKVVRLLKDEISGWDEDRAWDSRMSELARIVDEL